MNDHPERLRQYRELLDINRLITSSLEPQVVLDTVTRQAAALLRAEAAALLLIRQGRLVLSTAHQLPALLQHWEAPLGLDAMTRIRELGQAALPHCVGVPMVLRGQTIGVLAAYRREPGVTPDDEELLSVLADQAAVALENARRTEDLRRSEAQLRLILEHLPDGVLIHRAGRVVYGNRALFLMRREPGPGGLLGSPLEELYHPQDLPALHRQEEALLRGHSVPPREFRLRQANGSYLEVETTAMRGQFEDQPSTIVIARDLTPHKEAQREREEAYRRLRVIVDLAPVAIALVTGERSWDGNRRAHLLFGEPIHLGVDGARFAARLLDPTERPVPPTLHPLRRALRGEPLSGVELRLRRADGGIVPVMMSAAAIPGDGVTTPSTVLVFEDLTAAKELETLRVEWSALVAHDLRQPLSGIELYAQSLARQKPSDERVERRVSQIRQLVRRLNRMIQDLVDFTQLDARQLRIHCQPIDLAGLLENTLLRLGAEAPDRPMQLRLMTRPLEVEADPDRITQVVENLLTNAVKYGEPGTPIDVTAMGDADQVQVSVTNRGRGISPEQMPLLFGRYQRALDAQRWGHKGIGLGLYISRELVAAHHGRIEASSTPEGTTFRFALPRVQLGQRTETEPLH